MSDNENEIENMFKDVHKNFYFYADHTFEPWDYRNPLLKGIGGSETSQIEMASRLAQRHHDVVSYAPIPCENTFEERTHRDVTWKHFSKATFKEEGIWVIYRCPEALDNFKNNHNGKIVWFVAQDVFYSTLTEERAAEIDLYICLCSDHARYIEAKHPYLKDKIVISSNGIDVDLIKELETVNKDKIVKNPHRLIYSSSPDRGLEQLIPIFQRVKEFIPDLELHVFYGFDNIDKVIEKYPSVAKVKDSIMQGINSTDGIFWHGRVGQAELLIEIMKSGIWCYPVNFTETSCISCMEMQACETIPVVSPVWALRENVMSGVFVEGDVKEKLTISRFVGEIIRLCQDENLRKLIIKDMKMHAQLRFNWERYVDQWEGWILQTESPYFYNQYAFQHKYAYGKILNVGCDEDSSKIRETLDAVNLDVEDHGKCIVDIVADFRSYATKQRYDTIILGDILEHTDPETSDMFDLLNSAKCNLSDDKNARVIITCPQDTRTREEQNENTPLDATYKGGISHFHRYVSVNELLLTAEKAELVPVLSQDLNYTHFHGIGLVCRRKN